MKYPLTLLGVVVLIALLIAAALNLGGGEQGQRFVIIVGVVGTTLTALLALLRIEASAIANAAVKVELETAAQATLAQTEAVAHEVRLNTAITKKALAGAESAYNEANHLNAKIAEQNRKFDLLLAQASRRDDARDRATDAASATIEDTHEKVTEVHERVVEAPDG